MPVIPKDSKDQIFPTDFSNYCSKAFHVPLSLSQYSLKALTLSNLLTHHVCSALQLPRDRENTKMIKSIPRNNNYWEKTGGYKIEIGRNR